MCSFLWMVVHHVRRKNCIASTLQCIERPRDEVAPAPPCILERQDWSCSWTAWAEPSPSTLALKLHIYSITSPAPRRVISIVAHGHSYEAFLSGKENARACLCLALLRICSEKNVNVSLAILGKWCLQLAHGGFALAWEIRSRIGNKVLTLAHRPPISQRFACARVPYTRHAQI